MPVPGLWDLLQTVQQTLEGTSPGNCLCLHYRKKEGIFALSPATTNNKEWTVQMRARNREMWVFLQLI